MSKRAIVGDAQYLEDADYERFTRFPQAALDDVVGDMIGYPAHWSGFTVARKSAQEIVVSPGRYFEGRVVYASEAAQTINLTQYFPIAASDEKWIALIARGILREEREERAFQSGRDPETDEEIVAETPVIEHRSVNVVPQQGVATPAPSLLPEIAATDACIAFVRVTTTGVQDILPGEGWRGKSLFEVEGRTTRLELLFEAISVRTEVLETGMMNVNAAIDQIRAGMIRPEIFREVRRDVAAIARQIQVPEGARSAFYDPALVLDKWALPKGEGKPGHPSWRARIDEGIQFPFEQIKEARLEVPNEDSPLIHIAGRRMVPAWSKVKRIANEGGRTSKLISQQTHTQIDMVKREVSRSRIVYGPTVNVCENSAEWSRYSPLAHDNATYTKGNEQFEVKLLYDQTAQHGAGHNIYAVRTKKRKTYTQVYWDRVVTIIGLDGSVYGQTFLVDQPLIAPSIELEFAKIGADGAVHVYFCETDDTGAPIIADIIAEAKLDYAQLKLGWNEFLCDLTYFAPGKRYAWFAVTNGDHQIYGTNANSFSSGTSFRYTDGAWAQGDLEYDFNFRLNGCRFINSRTVVNFKAMDLPGGMTQFSLLYPNWEPEGTLASWEIQPVFGNQEDSPWSRLDPTLDDNPLNGLPAQVNLRCTLVATPDLAPMIELGADSVYTAARVRDEFLAVTERINFGLTTTTVEMIAVVDDFDPEAHVFEPGIMVGDGPAIIEPDVVTETIDEDKPSRRSYLCIFTVPAGTSVVRGALAGATDNIVNVFFGQNVAIFAK